MGCCSCGECMCHTLGLVVAVSGFTLTVLGLVLVLVFDVPDFWYKMGLGAFGVGGVLGIIFIFYTCFSMKRRWRLFGCCGDWGAKTKGHTGRMHRLQEERYYEEPKPNPGDM